MLIDLHTHTNASNSAYTLHELFQKANEKELEFLSITNHGTIDGLLTFQSWFPDLGSQV